MQAIGIIIASVIVYLIYLSIRKKVAKTFALKDTDITTDLTEFRESHATAMVIGKSPLNIVEGVVRKYERMCILDPVTYRNDPSIPQLITDYQDIISGKVIDRNGNNVPSEELLGHKNQDYLRYVTNQARALKSKILLVEKTRVLRAGKEVQIKQDFLVQLIHKGIPLYLAAAAVSDEKLNSFSSEDWDKFCSVIKGYLETEDRDTVQEFVTLFSDKKILFDSKSFETFSTFYRHEVPNAITSEIVTGKITVEQAVRMVELAQEYDFEWTEAKEEILSNDLKISEAEDLRKKYGWSA